MSRISSSSSAQRDENYATYSPTFSPPPRASTTSLSFASITALPTPERDYFDEEISLVLINSDSQECNENFSIFIKCIVDNIYNNTGSKPTYESLSLYALKLLTSNLFVKNFKFCIGKILAFLETFTTVTNYRLEFTEDGNSESDWEVNDQVAYEAECLKEFLCITLLLLLKLKNTSNDQEFIDDSSDISSASSATSNSLDLVNCENVFKTLEQCRFVFIMSQFISTQIKAVAKDESSFVILKFGCDIIFEYFYYVEVLSPTEFTDLTFNNNEVIVNIIKHLLSSEGFNNYDLENGDDFHNEARLVAYEELKLLLLINEQFLMSSYSRHDHSNKVFEELIHNDNNTKSNVNNIVGFINLLIYHLNREESQIIILLILKFLYLVFTTSFTAKLIYRNDLKILLDIFIRELDNLQHKDNILIVTYLRVLYPILMFSELNECGGYKSQQLYNVLSNIVVNSGPKSADDSSEGKIIMDLAIKCMDVKWLKNSMSPHKAKHNSTSGDGNSSQFEKEKNNSPEITSPEDLKSIDRDSSRLFTRIASVRSSSRSDYHKHTTQHNFLERKNSEKLNSSKTREEGQATSPSIFMDNNNNVFLTDFDKICTIGDKSGKSSTLTGLDLNGLPAKAKNKKANNINGHGGGGASDSSNDNGFEFRDANILDLPNEYLLSKPLPKLPIPEKRQRNLYQNTTLASSSSSLDSNSSIKQKALRKKAPPPPPPPPRRRR
ncbi:LDB17 [Candida theae]|uniref:LDB17 n=1 Tax=Candida theae TaxID=1198502 RepID=A0AAD5BCN9_9ASCO|nr:LDB17 [Candida theae]KAI5955515.1 LDB17 [Candida theae]